MPTACPIFATITILADADADGLPDDWETQNGFNPGVNGDQQLDFDQDGLTNGEEFIAGTDPRNPLSYLRIDLGLNGQSAQLNLMALSPRTYTVEYTDDLGSGNWQRLGDVSARTTNRVEIIPDLQWTPGRYYRLVTPQQP
jgi:hypothetical protein